jgi:hypothetical protein
MLSKLCKLGTILVVFFVSVQMASTMAIAASPEQDTGGYIVSPARSNTSDISIMQVYDTISQGQTKWYTEEVTEFITTLNVDLNWGNPSNSLRLRIFTADGYVLGPYYDNADGSIDGRINLDIYRENGIAKGTWSYEVYGYSVTGTEDFYI